MSKKQKFTPKHQKSKKKTAAQRSVHLGMQAIGAAGPFTLLGVEPSDGLVKAFLAVCNEPAMASAILNSAFGECANVCKMVWAALQARGSHGWQFALMRQNDDYHVFLINGDLQCHPAPETRGGHRLIARMPLEQLKRLVPGGHLEVRDTPDEIVVAFAAAGSESTPPTEG
jgi:hypothetical protein